MKSKQPKQPRRVTALELLARLPRGHQPRRGVQTHGDRRHKRLRTRGARRRAALREVEA